MQVTHRNAKTKHENENQREQQKSRTERLD